ncbi:MAG: hypothetical protein HWE25_10330 [Alphaproteobacteria bacterium]|nr:hypothetical protein [Alphaproteobacteria bacterium]
MSVSDTQLISRATEAEDQAEAPVNGSDLGPSLSGGETVVNTTTHLSQNDPAITELAGGGYIVVWESNHTVTSEGESTSWAQLYSADGEKVGSEFQVAGSDDVISVEDGGFVVVWQDGGVFAQKYDALGDKDGGKITVSGTNAHPSASALAGGGFVVTWNGYARIYDADAKETTDAFLLNTYSSYGTTWEVQTVGLDNGGFLAVFSSNARTGAGYDIIGRFFNAEGNATSSRIYINSVRTSHQTKPAVAELMDGSFAITWTTDQSDLSYSNTELKGRIITSNGGFASDEFSVNTNINNNQSSSTIAALPDGGFIVAWTSGDLSVDGSGTAIAGQRFDADGNAIGSEFALNSFHNGNQSGVDIAVMNSFFAAVWESSDTNLDGSLEAISSQLFDFAIVPNNIVGTDDADDIAAHDTSDVIDVMAGNDKVQGGVGNDSIIGGDGNDTLTGGSGDDTMIGGDGNDGIWAGPDDDGHDRIWGGAGADTLAGGKGGDLAVGGAGRDILFGGDGDDTLVGGDWDGEAADQTDTTANNIWGGTGNDVIHGAGGNEALGGGDGDDRINGGAGNDVIYAGLDGYDTLDGGDGKDVIFASYGHDVVNGGGGDDEIYGGSGNDYINGGNGDDTIYGGQGVDTIVGGAGDDTIRPGETADILIFAAGSGDDVVYGFNVEEDTLDLAGSAAGFNSVNDVVAAATETADGVLIDLGGGDSILLVSLSLTDLNSATFDL